MLWILQSGSSWRELSEEFGPWQTIYNRYQRWRRASIGQPVLDILSQGNENTRAGLSPE